MIGHYIYYENNIFAIKLKIINRYFVINDTL